MTLDMSKLRALAAAALANTSQWCGQPHGEWTRERALINFRFIQTASPSAVMELIDEVERLRATLVVESDRLEDAASIVNRLEASDRIANALSVELKKLRAEVEHMRPVYVAAEAWASAGHMRDHNCKAGDCDSCPARGAEAELYAAIQVAMGEQT